MWDFLKFRDYVAFENAGGQQLSYLQLDGLTRDFASQLAPRSLVFCLNSNTMGSVIGYLGCIQLHHVPLMLDACLDQAQLHRLMDIYRPAYLWLPSDLTVSVQDLIEPAELFTFQGYTLVRTLYQHTFALAENLALLLTTSGSTGSPKLVRLSSENILSNTQSIVSYLRLTGKEKAITVLPMHYTYGLSIINTHLYVGATILLSEFSLMQREFWDLMQNGSVTSFSGVPYTYEMLDKLSFYRRSLPSLKTMTQAGGRLSPQLHRKFAEYAQRTDKQFYVMYGAAEATSRMGYLPPDLSLSKCGAIGLAIPGGEFTLIDQLGREISSPDTIGELVYTGPNVSLGYAVSGADLNKGDENHGRLLTGDLAYFDAQRIFFIAGRKKRFIKIFGNRISLDDAESLIKDSFPDLECACAGVDNQMYIFLNSADRLGEVKEFMSRTTKLNPLAFKVLYLEGIPKNSSGKVLYSELERFYE